VISKIKGRKREIRDILLKKIKTTNKLDFYQKNTRKNEWNKYKNK